MMFRSMLFPSQNFQIFNSIVRFYSIFVMDKFSFFKQSSKMFFHYETMFQNIPRIITGWPKRIINSFIFMSCVVVTYGRKFFTFFRTSFSFLFFTRMNPKIFFTISTFNNLLRPSTLTRTKFLWLRLKNPEHFFTSLAFFKIRVDDSPFIWTNTNPTRPKLLQIFTDFLSSFWTNYFRDYIGAFNRTVFSTIKMRWFGLEFFRTNFTQFNHII